MQRLVNTNRNCTLRCTTGAGSMENACYTFLEERAVGNWLPKPVPKGRWRQYPPLAGSDTRLDTFDRRLLAKGFTLSFSTGHGRSSLLLRAVNGDLRASVIAPQSPAFVRDIPPGELHRLLLPVAGIRRLLPTTTAGCSIISLGHRAGRSSHAMTVLATYNIKGGVGKTAAAVNLAFLAARDGARTLLWDLDPQGAATFYYRVKPKIKGGAKGLVNKEHEAGDLIKGTDYPNLDLLPADFSYRHLDVHLGDKRKPTRALAKVLKPFAAEYDFIILDCPPGISLVSEAVFETADYLLVPLIPTTLSVRTLEQLMSFGRKHDLQRMTLLPFFSMVDRRKRLHREIIVTLTARLPDMLTSEIPYSSEVEKMGVHRAALPEFAGQSRGALAYETLWQEIRQRICGSG